MKVKILGNIEYQTIPITEDMVEIDDNILKEIGKTKQFDKNGDIVDYFDVYGKIQELKQNLLNTDYLCLKYAEGELTEEEYATIKAQRKEWRAEINRLEEELKNGD